MMRLYPGKPTSEVAAAAAKVAKEVAAQHAADVDQKARFPTETFEALKKVRALSAAVPTEFGGAGAGMQELSAQCAAVAQGCGSSAMVLAMHHIQVACIARHGLESPFYRKYLEEIVDKQLLLGSITSEVGVWGDTRSSICALGRDGDDCKLDKKATTGSYAAQSDGLLVTCRRNPDAAKSDQVLVLMQKGQFELEQTSTWDTMGMRGTCSPGFDITSTFPAEQVLPGSYADASAQTMVSYSHILWSALWLGIAADAVSRAGAVVRKAARRTPGEVPFKATRLAEVAVELQAMRNNVAGQAAEFDDIMTQPDAMDQLLTIGWALKMNNLKVGSSQRAPQIVQQALQIVGIAGFKNDSPFSLGRQLRDVMSAALMVSNDRILNKTASLLLVHKDL